MRQVHYGHRPVNAADRRESRTRQLRHGLRQESPGTAAALDLCFVAAGRAELFFELSLSPWDYAAGALIVEEAGGIVTDIDGHALGFDRKSSVLARNKVAQPIT